MTYIATDASTHDGMPVELFQFRNGASEWTYTNALTPITYSGDQYVPISITRGDLNSSGSFDKQDMEVVLPRTAEIGGIWLTAAPSDVVELTVFRHHLTDGGAEFVVLWKGRVLSARWSEKDLTLTAESVLTSLKRNGLSRRFQHACPYALYSGGCGLAFLNFEVVGQAAVISGNTLTVNAAAGHPDGYFSGGFLTWQNNQTFNIEKRFIASHTGQTLVLDAVVTGLDTGIQDVKMYPGCDKTITTCKDKFNNSDNYGGFPYIPTKNPFGGIDNPIF